MKIKFFLCLILAILVIQKAQAEVIPIQITPAEIISTHNDEVQIGDWISFQTTKDVYRNGQIWIKKYSEVIGIVDFYHPNGWCADDAEIRFEKFFLIDEEGKKIEFHSPLQISEHSLIKNRLKNQIKHEFKTFIRGAEIYFDPDSTTFTLFIRR